MVRRNWALNGTEMMRHWQERDSRPSPGEMGKKSIATNRFSGCVQPIGAVSEHGSAIVICMLVLVLLSLLAVYATNTSTLEVRIAAHEKQATVAFYAAESGVSEVRARLAEWSAAVPYTTDWSGYLGQPELARVPWIARELAADNEPDPVPSAQAKIPFLVRIRYLNEDDCGLDLCGDGLMSTDIRFWGDVDGDGLFEENPSVCGGPTAGTPIAVLTSWGIAGAGNGAAPSVKKITVEVRRNPLKPVLFGDSLLTIQNSSAISAGTGAPNSAHIGGNTEIRMSSGLEIEGEILLGRQPDGTPAALVIEDGSSANAHGGTIHGNRMEPDPLGLSGGPLADSLQKSRLENDNFIAATPAISDQTIYLGSTSSQGTSMTLTPGTYHLNSVTIEENCTLTIDNTTGTITLFLDGPFQAAEQSRIQVLGSAETFQIICGAEDQLTLAQDDHFKGCIYAPRGTVFMHNSGNITGMIWANRTILENSGNFFYEPKARNRFIHYTASLVTWNDR